MLIAGHTQRPIFPEVGEPLYFNDGCCVHPSGITGIEIANGNIIFVTWNVKTKSDGTYLLAEKAGRAEEIKGLLLMSHQGTVVR